MAIKDGKDYLYLIWKCVFNRRQYIVGQLTKNGQYEFQYCEEIEEALETGFTPLVSFERLDVVYKSEKLFYVAGARHYLGCDGNQCGDAIQVTRGDEVFLEHEVDNPHDENAIRVVNEQQKVLGYVPRYYSRAFVKFIEEDRVEECHIANVAKENCCDECIGVVIKITGLKK